MAAAIIGYADDAGTREHAASTSAAIAAASGWEHEAVGYLGIVQDMIDRR
jgi:hypothetical protein